MSDPALLNRAFNEVYTENGFRWEAEGLLKEARGVFGLGLEDLRASYRSQQK
jgi:hypothetical protein